MSEKEEKREFDARLAELVGRAAGEALCQDRVRTRELLDRINALSCSDAETAATLGISRSAISQWRSGLEAPSRDNLVRLQRIERVLSERESAGHWPASRGRLPCGRPVPLEVVEERAAHVAQARAKLYRLKRARRLTWDEVSALIGVYRQSVHRWLNGNFEMNPKHERRLDELLAEAGKGYRFD